MGKTTIQQPSPPPAPSTAESISAYLEGLPRMYAAQLAWQPKIEEQRYQTALQYAPQYTDIMQQQQMQYAPRLAEQSWEMQEQYAPRYAGQAQELQQQYQPEAYTAKTGLGEVIGGDYFTDVPRTVATDPLLEQMRGTVTPDWMTAYSAPEAEGFLAAKDRLRQDIRGAWASRGLAESGMSAEDEARLLAEMEYPYAMQQEQMTLDEANRRRQLGAQLGTQGLTSQQNAWQNYYNELSRRQNLGMSLAGYQTPSPTNVSTPQVQTAQFTPQNVMQGYNYGNVASNMQQGYGNYANAWSNAYATNANMGNPFMSALGGIGGNIAGNMFGYGGMFGQKI